MDRRKFIQNTVAGSALLGLSPFDFPLIADDVRHITILHTNDVHSYIDPFPENHAKNPGKGGVARRASLIESIRAENRNTLLFDAGDIFQGTPYFNYYGGALELRLMSMMKYDLATMGNHDFDNGIDGFYSQLHNADFGFVSANYDFSNTVLDGIVKPYRIFQKGGIKIGVFGLGIELAGLVDKKLYKETKYLDPVGVTKDIVAELKNKHQCEMIICLSHLGYKYSNTEKISDMALASVTKDIDLIIGGHTHTFLDKPTIAKNSAGADVVINQTGCYGLNLGRIDFYLKLGNSKSSVGRQIIV